MSFVDTNVLVYSTATGAPLHLRARAALSAATSSGRVAISRQILREYLSVATRPQAWAQPRALIDAMADADRFARRFLVLEDGPRVWGELRALAKTFAFGGPLVNDANIVATMLAYRETRIVTFNVADFRRFGSLIQIVAP